MVEGARLLPGMVAQRTACTRGVVIGAHVLLVWGNVLSLANPLSLDCSDSSGLLEQVEIRPLLYFMAVLILLV